MNKAGELEIAINKRLVERAAFIIVIIALGVFSYVQNVDVEDNRTEQVTILTQRVAEQNTQLEELARQLSLAEEKIEEQAELAAAVPAPEPEEEEPKLSGVVTYDWEVDGSLQTAADYNAEEIAALEAELEELEERYEDASTEAKPGIRDTIEEIEDEIAILLDGEPKFKLNGVDVIIDNGKEDSIAIDYILCWPQIDCLQVTAEGTINVASGTRVTEALDITIPKTVTVDKTKQVLRLALKQDNKEVFKKDFTITPQ